MNIEDEKKAFELVFKNADLSKNSKGDYENNAAHWAYTGWLTAKRHAAEMAKPVARYALIGGIVNLYFDVGLDKPGVCKIAYFETVADAKVWASNNGYRVIE